MYFFYFRDLFRSKNCKCRCKASWMQFGTPSEFKLTLGKRANARRCSCISLPGKNDEIHCRVIRTGWLHMYHRSILRSKKSGRGATGNHKKTCPGQNFRRAKKYILSLVRVRRGGSAEVIAC